MPPSSYRDGDRQLFLIGSKETHCYWNVENSDLALLHQPLPRADLSRTSRNHDNFVTQYRALPTSLLAFFLLPYLRLSHVLYSVHISILLFPNPSSGTSPIAFPAFHCSIPKPACSRI